MHSFSNIAILLLATLAQPGLSKRGGGGSDSDSSGDDGSGGGGEGGGGSSGGSYFCGDTRGAQAILRHVGPLYSRYFDGVVSITYSLDQASENSSQDCVGVDGATHEYNYDATLRVSGYVDLETGKFTDFGWQLKGFKPWGSLGNVVAQYNPNPPLREVIGLGRYVYVHPEQNFENGTRDDATGNVETWDVNTLPSINSTTGEIDDVGIVSTFLRNPPISDILADGETYGQLKSKPAGNWISLDEVCAQSYSFDDTWEEFGPVTGKNRGSLATLFLQPNTSDMTATITGLGTNTAEFKLTNGSFIRAIGGGEAVITCSTVYDNDVDSANSQDASDVWAAYVNNRAAIASRQWFWNATGTFEISFRGELNVTASQEIEGYDNDTALPIFSADTSGSSLKAMSASSLALALVFCTFLISYV